MRKRTPDSIAHPSYHRRFHFCSWRTVKNGIAVVMFILMLIAIYAAILTPWTNPQRPVSDAAVAGEKIREALVVYASRDSKQQYPPEDKITGYNQLEPFVKAHTGSGLVDRPLFVRLFYNPPPFDRLVHYGTADTDQDGWIDAYSMRLAFQFANRPRYILVTPGGVFVCRDQTGGDCS